MIPISMNSEILEATLHQEPFPLMIIENFYNEVELNLIWEELNFLTKPKKLMDAKNYGGVIDYTNAKALILDDIYENHRNISNILTVNRKLFKSGVLDNFAEIHPCCKIAPKTNWDCTKLRYYHDGEYYDPHTDRDFQFLAFSYFYREPKKFSGGDLFFPEYDFSIPCDNNTMVIFPGWVEHGVRKITIKNSDYFDGYGRYAITSFFGCRATNKNKKLTS